MRPEGPAAAARAAARAEGHRGRGIGGAAISAATLAGRRGIQHAQTVQPLERGGIVGHVLGLAAHGFVPCQSQPGEVLGDCAFEPGAAAGGVDVLDA
jgi:hypothetical protein